MSTDALKKSLTELRTELADRHQLDQETRRQLAEVADRIEQLLDDSDPDVAEVSARVENAALAFEARHPSFARILSEVTDALAKLGI